MRVRNVVIGMLFVTVIAPIVLYTDRFAAFKASSSRNELLEDATAFTLPGDTRHLNLLPQESSTILKEPIGIVYTDNSTATSSDIQTKDLQLPDTREHKSARVLSAANEQDQSRVDNTIRQVIVAADQKGSRMDGGNDAKQNDKKTRENASQNGLDQQSGLASGKVNKKNSLPTKTDKGMDQMAVSDLRVQQLKDQLIRAKVYLSLPGTKNNPHFTRELRLRIKEVQRVLGDATKDYELPRNANEKLKAMEQSLAKGQRMQDNCAAVVKKLRAMLHSTEEQLRVHRKQTVFLTQLTAKTLPKGLHCLPLHLTTEYYHLNNSERQFPNQEKLEDIQLHHYALFSDNVLATAVVVNSTVSHAKVSRIFSFKNLLCFLCLPLS
uniref:Hexosyltransferase n=1 Tax=Rhizophora mucronata TaxID=61149 RepID=A0A2P2LNI1_RHIMU